MKKLIIYLGLILPFLSKAQLNLQWKNVDSLYQPLPPSLHVYFTEHRVDSAPFRAYYVIADLKDKKLDYTTDTTFKRRLTPQQFFDRNDQPLVVVNGTFFSFQTNLNLNTVIMNGRIVSFDHHVRPLRGKDTLLFSKHLTSAIGISKKRKADVAWIYNDSGSRKMPVAFQKNPKIFKDSTSYVSVFQFAPQLRHFPAVEKKLGITSWKMKTAIGGGPVLLHDGKVRITNNEEMKFGGKAINDKHPRTAMGYTADNKLIILVVEGRNPKAAGTTLIQEAQILQKLGCIEALNLDGGGSSTLLVNGKETIKPSDKEGQRPVPAVFMIKKK